MAKFLGQRLTRRQALEGLGIGAAAAVLPGRVCAQTPVFPKGAVIRPILKDYAPEELAGGATLFHEHVSASPDLLTRIRRYTEETRAANGLPPLPPATIAPPPAGPYFMQDLDLMVDEMSIAKREGISCIVDGGHPDMGRDINFLRQVSLKSGLPIVAGAGFYTQPFYPKEISTMSEEQIVQALVKQTETDPVGVFGEIG